MEHYFEGLIMLPIPEFLLFTASEPAAERVQVVVEFTGPMSQIPIRYIDDDLLNQMILAASRGILRFISFDEHPMRVDEISYSASGRRAIIKVRPIRADEQLPDDPDFASTGQDAAAKLRDLLFHEMDPRWPSRLRVGTLSSEVTGGSMAPVVEGNAVNAILQALDLHHPDVLLTAGYSVEDGADLDQLELALKASGWDGLLFAEVRRHDGDAPDQIDPEHSLSPHCLFAWTRERGWQLMGRQYFATSVEAQTLGPKVRAFEANLPNRVIDFRGRRFGALICGEINALQGRGRVQALTPEIELWLRSLDVIVNPTHDLMGNGGTLKAKRKWMSLGGRAYVSASNWNSMKMTGAGQQRRQSRRSGTLHSCFVDGHEAAQQLDRQGHESYEYREVCL